MLYESSTIAVHCDDGVATLWLNFPGLPANLFDLERLGELDRGFAAIEAHSAIEILVIRSAKLAGFCAGFDPDAIANLNSDDDAREFAVRGQQVFSRIADAPFITLAYLDGSVYGPGLDLALACDYRVAVATPRTRLGYPEMQHGVLPAWGGITRLARLLGAARAVEFITNNETLTAREAKAFGLVDHAFCERRAKIELRTFLDSLQRRPRKSRRWHTPLDAWAARRVVAAYGDWLDRTPNAAAVRLLPHAAQSVHSGLLAERTAFVQSQAREESRAAALLWQDECLLRSALRMAAFPARIGIVGPLESVAWFAAESLLRGSRVIAVNLEEADESHFIQRQIDSSSNRLTPLELDQARGRFRTANDGDESTCDLVLLTGETAQAIELAEWFAKPQAPIAAVNANMRAMLKLSSRPRTLVGLNLTNTALAEIVRSQGTALFAIETLRAWLVAFDFTPLIISAKPGALVRTLLVAWWDEAVRLVAEGVPIAMVDRAARSLGASTGPLEMLDGVGLDAVANQVPRVKPLLAAGIHGRPHSEGFYVLAPDSPTCPNALAQLVLLEAAGQKANEPPPATPRHCEERFAARLLVTAANLLAQDECIGPAEIDLAVVRGIGAFADRGGILRHVDRVGLRSAIARLRNLQQNYGERFKPPAELSRRAAAEESFHGTPAGPPAARLLTMTA